MALKKDLAVRQGSTFVQLVRWETDVLTYKTISAVGLTAPVTITATGHGVPNGWRVAITGAKGPTQINAASVPPKASDYVEATVVDANTLTINTINAVGLKAYTGNGVLQYYTPHDLSGYTARLTVKDKLGGVELLSLTTENGGISVDNVGKLITITVTATASAALAWVKGVYDLELVSPTGVVTALMYGTVTVTKEVTT
jgi:hypothetical protein